MIGGFLVVGAFLWMATWPATTRQGVNFEVQSHSVPWAVKSLEFFLRDYRYRRLAQEVTLGSMTDEAKGLALFKWTRGHIRPHPKGWPLVDDHIWDIIIRGYGSEDQMADVFTTLATYSGLPAFWKIFREKTGEKVLVFSFVRIDDQWTVWDVARGVGFRNEAGDLVSVEELMDCPEWLRSTPQVLTEGLIPFAVPQPLRAEKQMIGRRLKFEVKEVWRTVRNR